MSFLDNLENSLKALEGRDDGAGLEQERDRRESERQEALAAAPYAARLKSGPFTAELMNQATRAGYAVRLKVQFTWLGTSLRLQARDRKLDLRPTPEGIVGILLDGSVEVRRFPVDLEGDPTPLVQELLVSP